MAIEEREPDGYLIRTPADIPENERWLHTPQAKRDLERALAWAQTRKPDDSHVDEILERLRNAP